MDKVLLAGAGGFLGSACRYWLSSMVYKWMGQDFPYGTLAVNVIGCLLIGLLMQFFENRFLVPPNLRLFLTIGILGGFTTFSSFSYETVSLLREGSLFLGSLNIVASVLTCLFATWLGMALGKIL